MSKPIHDLALHERVEDDIKIVERVPNGWNYIYKFNNQMCVQFVPYHKEFKAKAPKQQSMKLEDSPRDEVLKMIAYWNSLKIIKYTGLPTDISLVYNTAKKKHTKEKIIEAMKNYAAVIADQDHFFNTKWPLLKFLKQGNCIPDFVNEGDKWINYKSANQSQKPIGDGEDEDTNERFTG